MKHLEQIIPEETAFETGKRISYLRYDSLEELLSGIETGLKEQSQGDSEKNRPKLAALGWETAQKIEETTKTVAEMWRISKPYMKDSDEI
jgi:hypothetical protein